MELAMPMNTYQNGHHVGTLVDTHTDVLTVIGKDDVPRDFSLDTESISLGRAHDNDIVLNDYAISRFHLRMDRTDMGWEITDLNSTNGALVGGKRLLPNQPMIWSMIDPMLAGPFELRWRRFEHDALHNSTIVMNVPSQEILEEQREVSTSNEYVELGAQIDKDELLPGESAMVELTLLSLGVSTDDFVLEVEGVPSEWVRLAEPFVRLPPTEIQKSHFTITIPHTGMAVRGDYAVRVHLRSTTTMRAAAMDEVHFGIKEEHGLELSVRQVAHKSGMLCDVLLKNEGNSADFYTLTVNSYSDKLQFNARQWKLALTPHTGDQVRILVSPTKRKWFGEAEQIPYSLHVSSESGLQRNHEGYVEIQPRLDIQTVILAFFVIAGVAGLVWLILFLLMG